MATNMASLQALKLTHIFYFIANKTLPLDSKGVRYFTQLNLDERVFAVIWA